MSTIRTDFCYFFNAFMEKHQDNLKEFEGVIKDLFKAFGYSVEFLHVLDRVYVTVRCKEHYIVFFNVYDNVSRETYFNKW